MFPLFLTISLTEVITGFSFEHPVSDKMFESWDMQQSSLIRTGVLVILTFYIVKRVLDKVVSLRQALSNIRCVCYRRVSSGTVVDMFDADYAFRGCPGGEILWIHPFRSLAFFLSSWYPAEGQIGSLWDKFSCQSSIVLGRVVVRLKLITR
jgi:hypothetical protein